MLPVVLDVDGVLAEFTEALLRFAGREPRSSGRQPTWGFPEFSNEEWAALWERMEREPDFWLTPERIPSWAEVAELNALARHTRIVYATSRPKYARAQTERWLRICDFPVGGVLVTKAKPRRIAGRIGPIAGMLDDSPAIVEEALAAKLPITVRDWPYNRHVVAPRVYSLGEFIGGLM